MRNVKAYSVRAPSSAAMTPASEATSAASAADCDQRRFGGRRAKAEAKGEAQQGGRAPLARECLRKRLAEGKEAAFETLDEKRESDDDAQQADRDAGQIRKRLLQHDDLKERDD